MLMCKLPVEEVERVLNDQQHSDSLVLLVRAFVAHGIMTGQGMCKEQALYQVQDCMDTESPRQVGRT